MPTLGEALSLRARQAQKLNDLSGRIKSSSVSQEGSPPPEDAGRLIEEYLAVSSEHAALMVRIAYTNANTDVDGVSLLSLLHQREGLIRERNIYALSAQSGSAGGDSYRYMRSELKYVPTVDVPDLRRKEDEVNEQVRVLDAQIQKVNWATDLM